MDLLDNLNKEQKQAVLHSEGPLLVVAGAGTGKTKVITHRISHLLEKGVPADKILAVTFTNKAAGEMRGRVAHKALTIGTFHAIASAILRKYGSRVNIPSHFLILDEQETLGIVKTAIGEAGLDIKQFRPDSIKNLISKQKSSKSDFDTRSRTSTEEDFFPKKFKLIWENYEALIRAKNALDFDDLIQKTVFLFEERPEILQICQEKWPYIHIDEYQDTDPGQAYLIKLLAQKYQNICAVGDEDQSIYGFRGADFRNILNFEADWPIAKTVILERNYRSSQRILEAANAVIAKNQARRKKNLYSNTGKGVKITAFEAKNEKEEANFVARQIKILLQKSPLAFGIAVLCRANSQFPVFEEAFLRHNLPFQTASYQDSLLGEPKPIRLMTVHAAKGLEFQYVFIPGLEKGLFPCVQSEEERRLFYVALTRAREKIFLSWPRYRTVFGAKQINQPSQFLSDIPQNLLKWL